MAIGTNRVRRVRVRAIAEPVATRAEDHDRVISFIDLLVLLTVRRRMIVLVTAVCGIGALLLALILPKEYTAKTTILPPRQNSSIASALTSQMEGLGAMAALAGGALGLQNQNDMYVAMLRSSVVEDAMIRRWGLMKEYHCQYLSQARKKFEKHVTINGDGKDNLIHVEVEDRNPQRAAEMANGYIDQFRKLSESLAITEASQRRLFFEQQLEQTKNKLADAEEALKATEQKTGMLQLDSQARALIESAAELRAQIAAKEVQLQMMRSYATSQNASMVEAQEELDGLRAQLARLGGNQDNLGAGLIAPKGVVPQNGLEYVRKLRDVKYYEAIFDILARQYELAKLDEAKEGALIQTVDPALVPDRPSFPKRGLFTAAGLALGFLLGVGLAFTQAALAHLRKDPETNAKLGFLHSSYRLRSWRR